MRLSKPIVFSAILFVLVLLLVVLATTGNMTRSKNGATGTTEFGGAYLQYDWATGYNGSLQGSENSAPNDNTGIFKPSYGIAPASTSGDGTIGPTVYELPMLIAKAQADAARKQKI